MDITMLAHIICLMKVPSALEPMSVHLTRTDDTIIIRLDKIWPVLVVFWLQTGELSMSVTSGTARTFPG